MIVCEEVDIPSQPKCHPAVFDILKNILNVELSLEELVFSDQGSLTRSKSMGSSNMYQTVLDVLDPPQFVHVGWV